ncbi:MAG: ribosome recycling factor [Elusimicrobia bacterium]|nr:ribosome recycling factor [Elusimicrobiota bacterium]
MVKQIVIEAEEKMKRTVERLKAELLTLRTGRANASLLEGVRVEYYGSMVPLRQAANVAIPEPRIIEIRPWDHSLLPEIEKAILKTDLGMPPTNDGQVIRLMVPSLTEERRKELVKVVRKMTEEFRVAIRNERRDAVETLKKAEKRREISEDDRVSGEQAIQRLTDSYIKKIDETLAAKEHEIAAV